ncbi:MAG TPA: LysE family transporter [Halococcus sp.]|nr:LysE family transporter [Halococcus sp.]
MSVLGAVTTVLAGAVFGLAVAAPPGPMNAVIAEESVLRGWSAGFRAGLGAMTADICFFFLALFGAVALVERVPTVRVVAFAFGGVLMLYFAYGAARDAGTSFETDIDGSRGFKKAFVLAITNPFQIAFWLTIGVSLLEPGRLDVLSSLPVGDFSGVLVVSTGSPALLVGFFCGIAVWVAGFPAALVTAKGRAAGVGSTVAYASALVLFGFGILFLGEALSTMGSVL